MDSVKLEKEIGRHISTLSLITSTKGHGVTRFPFTNEARECCEYLKLQMEEAGMQVSLHNSGSIIGRVQGEVDETILLGSHYDSVYQGGAYDGTAGVITALEAVKLIKETGKTPYYSLEVIATNDEEGVRFKTGLFTGKVFWGQYTPEDLKQFADVDGITLYQAMNDFGIDPDNILNGKVAPSKFKAFLEVHIEQGPILEHNKMDIGIVNTIVGFRRKMITVNGRADHSGTIPMDMRIDAVEIATKVISKIGDIARDHGNSVATVGHIEVQPNAINTIANKVIFSTDVRSVSSEHIDSIYQRIELLLEEVSRKYNGNIEIKETLNITPLQMNKELQEIMSESCVENNYSYMAISSGAGHDAQIFGTKIPVAMMFVPSSSGRSHCPEEYTDNFYMAQATVILKSMIEKICNNHIYKEISNDRKQKPIN